MPQLDENTQRLLDEGTEYVEQKASRLWGSFQDLILRDNVLEVAIGLIVAASFTTVVNAFISDLLLPPISLLPFINKQLDEKFAVLRSGPNIDYSNGSYWGYNTLKQAIDDGAVVLAYGDFINKLINFLGVGFALFLIANLYQWIAKDPIIHETTKCPTMRKLHQLAGWKRGEHEIGLDQNVHIWENICGIWETNNEEQENVDGVFAWPIADDHPPFINEGDLVLIAYIN